MPTGRQSLQLVLGLPHPIAWPEHLTRGVQWGFLIKCPCRLIWLISLHWSSNSTLSPTLMTELFSGKVWIPCGRNLFWPLLSCFYLALSCHNSQLVTIAEGRNVDRRVNWELHVSSQLLIHHRLIESPHDCRRCTDLPVNLLPHSSVTCELDRKIPKLLQ